MGISEFLFGYGVSWSDWLSYSDEWDGYLAIIFWVGLLEIYFHDYFIISGIAILVLAGREIMSFTQVFMKNVEKNRLSDNFRARYYSGPIWTAILITFTVMLLFGFFFFARLIKGSRFIPKNLASSFRKLKQR